MFIQKYNIPFRLKYVVCAIFSLNILSCFCEDNSKTWNNNQQLRKDLLKGYDLLAMPQRYSNGTTTVSTYMVVNGLWIEDDKQLLAVNSWLIMDWTDERLVFDYKSYGKIGYVHFGDNEIWKPDLHVYNNARLSEFDHYQNTHLIVYPTGHVYWIPPAHFEVNCPLDLKFWPFDIHSCTIILGSWTSHGWLINLELSGNYSTVDTTQHEIHGTNIWKVLGTSQSRVVTRFESVDEPYVHLEFHFKIQRNSPTFAAIVVVPAVVIPIFLMLQFVLPVDHPKRLTIGCVCAILVLLEMLYLKFSLPKLGTSVPLIVTYYSQSFVLVMLSVAISAVLGRLAHPQNPLVAYPPPPLLKRFMTGIPATVLCLRDHANKVGLSGTIEEDGEVLDKISSKPCYAHEWLFLAKAGDRVCVILFLALYILSLIGYVSPLK